MKAAVRPAAPKPSKARPGLAARSTRTQESLDNQKASAEATKPTTKATAKPVAAAAAITATDQRASAPCLLPRIVVPRPEAVLRNMAQSPTRKAKTKKLMAEIKAADTVKSSLAYYKLGPILGQGAFGKVCVCCQRLSGEAVAVKSYNQQAMSNRATMRGIEKEIATLSKVRHVGIAYLLEVVRETRAVHLCVEYLPGGSLKSLLRKARGRHSCGIDEPRAIGILKQLLSAVAYLHQRRIVHRDLKTDNIMFDHHGNAKLVDFGFSAVAKTDASLKEKCGTLAYSAPEIFDPKAGGYVTRRDCAATASHYLL